jgi:hypothetical protein
MQINTQVRDAGGYVGVCGQMPHVGNRSRVCLAHRRRYSVRILAVGFNELGGSRVANGRQVSKPATRQVVQEQYRVATPQKTPREINRDKSRTAGDKMAQHLLSQSDAAAAEFINAIEWSKMKRLSIIR